MRRPLIAALSILLGMPIAWAQTEPVPSGGLRLATYNAYLLSPIFKCPPPGPLMPDCLRQIEGETEAWAERLAAEILSRSDEFDVIALNEVWDEDAKQILADKLEPLYPVQVRKIDSALVSARAEVTDDSAMAEIGFKGEDSGLMLFAKEDFSVAPLPDHVRWPQNDADTLDASTHDVAFTLFETCASTDCLSAKGAALIRLRHKDSGQIHNIVFTHLQADYPEDGEYYSGVRLKQLNAIKAMIRSALPDIEQRLVDSRETLFMAGDLNIPFFKDRAEWNKRFKQGYFRKPLYESAAFTSSGDDTTKTNENDDERLDYILASPRPFVPPAKHSCVQHVTYPRAFRNLESDHYLVLADIQRGYAHCSPSIAFGLKLPASGPGVVIEPNSTATDARTSTRIHAPGAMQWFFIDAGNSGTFSIGTDRNEVVADIYLPEDLTTPVSRYNKTKATVPLCTHRCFGNDQYVLPPKFYIRVHGKHRSTVSDYALSVRRHTCASRAEACVLMPGLSADAMLSPEQTPLGTPQDEAWFRYDIVGNATSGEFQTARLRVDGIDASRMSVDLVDTSLVAGSGQPIGNSDGNARSFSIRAGDGSNGYLRVRQSARRPGMQGSPIHAEYDSDLRFLRVGNLICRDETNPESGSDDIYTRFFIDDISRRAPSSDYVEFDCDDHSDTEAWADKVGDKELRYLRQIEIRLAEEDDTSANDDSNRFRVEDLGTGQMRADGRLEWSFSDGLYRFEYELMRAPNAPRAEW